MGEVMRAACVLGLCALSSLCGCSDDDSAAESGSPIDEPSSCVAPDRVTAAGCLPPGVQDDGCPAGTLADAQTGECIGAGIPADGCAAGFVHDGGVGCDAVLPPGACPAGQMAVPGDTSCRAVMECGGGRWGDIPLEPGAQYVDASYPSGDSDGTEQRPWTTLADAYQVAATDGLIAIAEGTYAESLRIDGKAVKVWGVCPQKVSITASSTDVAAIDIRRQAAGTEVHGVGITGDGLGVVASGSRDVLLEQVWIHHTALRGIQLEDSLGSTALELRGSLVERSGGTTIAAIGAQLDVVASVVRDGQPAGNAAGRGIAVELNGATQARGVVSVRGSVIEGAREFALVALGADLSVEGSVVRDVSARSDGFMGFGLVVQDYPDHGGRGVALVRQSVFERTTDQGMLVAGSELMVEHSVVRDVRPAPADGGWGRGIVAEFSAYNSEPAQLVVRGSLVERNRDAGIHFSSANGLVERTVVRDTVARQSDGLAGHGIAIENAINVGVPSLVDVRGCVVERSSEFGIYVIASEATIDATVVRDTQPLPDGQAGRGISIQLGVELGLPSLATVRSSRIEDSRDLGLFIATSTVTVESTLVRNTMSQVGDGHFGHGVNVQYAVEGGAGASASFFASMVEMSRSFGVVVAGSDAVFDRFVVRDTTPREADGAFGDGLSAFGVSNPTSAAMRGCRIDDSARAGLSSFGGRVALEGNIISCAQFDLAGEDVSFASYVYEDGGGNQCGCPEPDGACTVVSAGIHPPDPPEL